MNTILLTMYTKWKTLRIPFYEQRIRNEILRIPFKLLYKKRKYKLAIPKKKKKKEKEKEKKEKQTPKRISFLYFLMIIYWTTNNFKFKTNFDEDVSLSLQI